MATVYKIKIPEAVYQEVVIRGVEGRFHNT
jgi:hypothetical protein